MRDRGRHLRLDITIRIRAGRMRKWRERRRLRHPVPPQNPIQRTIVDVSALGVELGYPDASLAVCPARDRQIEPEAAA
jgi:hypothetical protein